MNTAEFMDEENEHKHTPRHKKLIILSILVLLLISVIVSVAYTEVSKSKSKTLKFINPTEKNFIKTTTVLGRVVPSHTEEIFLNSTKGSIKEIFVKVGETVSKGQNLFSYDDATVEAEVRQAELNKKLAETSVSQRKEQIASIEQEIQEANSVTISNATMIQSLETELKIEKKDLNTAELKVEKYSLEAEKLKAQQESLTVKSNNDGVILNLNQDIGQGFRATDKQQISIMQIASNEPFQIEGMLTELEKAKISLGQSITVKSKVVPNKKWEGIISEVSDYPTFKTSVNKGKAMKDSTPYYLFKASLDSQKGLYPGYYITLDVVVFSKRMLAIPNTSIEGSGKSQYVYVLKKGKLHKQKVRTGQKKDNWVAIIKGLKKEDKIVVKPNWTVKEGTKIDLK